MEDAFLLYEAKYGLRHMDASTMQDRYSITVSHKPTEVIKYVESSFQDDPDLRADYSGLIDELQGIIDAPDYESVADYSKFIRGYFFGHDNVEINPSSGDGVPTVPKRRRWKFW